MALKLRVIATVVIGSWGCASSQLTIERQGEARAIIYDLKDLSDPVKELPQGKIELGPSEYQGKAIKVFRSSEKSLYIAFIDPESANNLIRINVDNPEIFGIEAEVVTNTKGADENRNYDMILRSYQAVLEKNFEEARKLSSQLIEVKPRLAAPHILQGMAYYFEGDRTRALASYKQALALDPANADLKDTIQKLNDEG